MGLLDQVDVNIVVNEILGINLHAGTFLRLDVTG